MKKPLNLEDRKVLFQMIQEGEIEDYIVIGFRKGQSRIFTSMENQPLVIAKILKDIARAYEE